MERSGRTSHAHVGVKETIGKGRLPCGPSPVTARKRKTPEQVTPCVVAKVGGGRRGQSTAGLRAEELVCLML